MSRLYPQPYRGITVDGRVRANLYQLAGAEPGEAAPTAAMVRAAEDLVARLDAATRDRLTYPLGAHEWRSWANPESIQHHTGIRLDAVPDPVREAALALVAASLSPAGYELVRNLMRINGFLGQLTDLPLIVPRRTIRSTTGSRARS